MHLTMVGKKKLRIIMVRDCGELSVDCEDDIFDRDIDPAEISRCLRKLKSNKTGG